jgi:hypothetical protein
MSDVGVLFLLPKRQQSLVMSQTQENVCRQGVQNDTTMSAFADMSLNVGNSFELKHKKCIFAKVPVLLG